MAALAAAVWLTQTLAAQVDGKWLGTWAFNPARSNIGGQAPFKKAFLEIEPSGDSVTIVYDLFRDRGGVTHLEWTGRFDGRDYALQGVDQYSVTNAYRRLDDRTYEIVQKVDGAISMTATIGLSADGKTLTTITRGKNALGEDVTTTTVYEKR
ncbi:MAG: hypothetical protein WBD07_15815 [Vicinamibacterales bacterium]